MKLPAYLVLSGLVALPVQAQTVVSAQAPVEAVVPVDAAKLAISKRIAARLIPDGIIQKVMGSTMNMITGPMMDQMMDMPMKDLVGLTGLGEDKLSNIGPGTIKEVMAILDPAFQERSKRGMDAMMTEMTGVMSQMEPELRDAMAEAFANQFSPVELGDLDRFFATPSGISYASKMMTLQTDPAFMKRMQGMAPKILEAMPAIVAKATAATESLPKPRKASELGADDRKKLAALLGVKPSELD